ncbi:hypothetical protein [Pseudanabaena sp. ABRG5-3]|uniref:hypothetical protein n=1 Tax=Pseudanabaena sp. ABRG5-3 TaxID=685565 RepID=UPI000DC712E7|nr:hypothetical protein [Pseudanabaena sp. ABRG5-3]BBC26847.1 hypothetical protein ABRG53_c008 [Pseudanabaena sp. ABRG5-3]
MAINISKSMNIFRQKIHLLIWILSKSLYHNIGDKLIIRNPTFFETIHRIIFCTPHITIAFLLPLWCVNSFVDSLSILNTSKLICNRYSNEIICSVTGRSLYDNVEKVISSEKEGLISVKTKLFPIGIEGEDNTLLVISTNSKEVTLYSQKDIVENQILQLNSFFNNSLETRVYIESRASSNPINRIIFLVFFTGFWDLITFSILYRCIRDILSIKIYAFVFDKATEELTSLEISRKSLLKVPIKRIAKIYLENGGKYESHKIIFVDDSNSPFLSIDFLNSITEVSEITSIICTFLEIEHIEIPP